MELVFGLYFIFSQANNGNLNRIYVYTLILVLRYNSYTVQFTNLKWVSVYSQSTATIAIINFRTFSSVPKEIPHPSAVTLHSSRPPVPGNHQPTFFLYGLPIVNILYTLNQQNVAFWPGLFFPLVIRFLRDLYICYTHTGVSSECSKSTWAALSCC